MRGVLRPAEEAGNTTERVTMRGVLRPAEEAGNTTERVSVAETEQPALCGLIAVGSRGGIVV